MNAFTGAHILITGGTGTLGQAIVRTAIHEHWQCAITIYSRSELRQALMRQQFPECRYILGDIRDADRTEAVIAGHHIVLHAAAMKRLPECEASPGECYATNIQGSLNVLRACQRQGVRQLIGISTDKACAATTAYGASKLAMEKAFCAPSPTTRVTVVRYGNVVASNGSVIPLWRQQAATGKPLTITDGEMTRFWMAPSQAVALITYAADLPPGLIAVPKMSALSVAEMAAIVAPNADQVEVGMRFAEKRHEDLIAPDEIVTELNDYYLIGRGTGGHRYTSADAPRLSAAEFRAMLDEADSYL